ncbi:hypothetical protein A2125_00045 [Candidatus Woesebacteria bacterium GWB1_43_5]|uniref:Methenyltetrahydrofolate cyclohydrolase n=1 Tax=Candidatus Woesebacteria bacterium GWB1_43_5 TaxID=1802474 RepID=A0A1F7WS64_9BACT|nr:MAG: hypothetical protein A2125_00045 [Candidatus Woesebacteria bacterium GWB1_43_5]
MKTIIFKGREFAKRKELLLVGKVKKLKKRGILPKLATILASDDEASRLYVDLKKKAAARVGVEVESYYFGNKKQKRHLIGLISVLNMDSQIHGIMIQLPLRTELKKYTREILEAIAPEKDVDGLREESAYMPACVRAIIYVIDEAKKKTRYKKSNEETIVAVYGSAGAVGMQLVRNLKKLGYKIIAVDKIYRRISKKFLEADILIGATGHPANIKGSMVKDGAIVIDIGSPEGDVLFDEVVKKASFITPVPGGVGPVTVVGLLENLLLILV